jgi:hypothetical protein
MPQTLNQLSQLDFQNNLVLNALNKDDKSASVYDLSGGYNVIDFLVTRGAPARSIDGMDGVFYKPIMGSSTPTAQIASSTVTSTSLMTVVFTDPSFDKFRLKEVIGDGTANMNLGRVIAKAAGTVTIEAAAGTSFVAGQTFAAGAFAVSMFTASGSRFSSGMESLYEYPKYIRNQTSITRESLSLARRDMSKTWVEYAGGMWYTAQEPLTVKRFARHLERKAIWSKLGNTTSSLEGDISYSMGLRESILDSERGGVYMPLSSSMTQGQFEAWIGRIADRQNSAKYKITLGVGRGFLSWIQSYTTPFIQFAGRTNTFGGESVEGLDVYNYSVNGVSVDLVMIPFFNDRDMFPGVSSIGGLGNFTRMQYTAIALDTNMYESVDGKMLPAMEKLYFGNEEVIYGYIPGLIGSSLSGSNTLRTGNILATNDKDGVTMEIYSDCAYDFMSYRMGWAEVVA